MVFTVFSQFMLYDMYTGKIGFSYKKIKIL